MGGDRQKIIGAVNLNVKKYNGVCRKKGYLMYLENNKNPGVENRGFCGF